MKIIENIYDPNFNLTKSDALILEFIKGNMEDVPYMQISEMAKTVGTGEATITRFIKKLGCSGFQEFKVCLAKEISIAKNNDFLERAPGKDESIEDTAEKIARYRIFCIEEIIKNIDYDALKKASLSISKASRIFTLGSGISKYEAKTFTHKLITMGLRSVSIEDELLFSDMEFRLEKDDIVVVFCTVLTDSMTKLIENVRKKGVKTVCIYEFSIQYPAVADINIGKLSMELMEKNVYLASRMNHNLVSDILLFEIEKNFV